jgi:hypothetical protein
VPLRTAGSALPAYKSVMSPFRIAYILWVAAVIVLRLVCASPPVSASDQPKMLDNGGRTGDAWAEFSAQEPDFAPLVTGRSVAAPSSRASDSANEAERKPREGVGALGFVRR